MSVATSHRTHRHWFALATAVAALIIAVTACVPPAPGPVPPTTVAPSTVPPTTVAPTTACDRANAAYLAQINSGAPITPTSAITFEPVTALDNPTTAAAGSTGTSTVTVSFDVVDSDGDAVSPDPTHPVTVSIYGAGAALTATTPTAMSALGADPTTLQVTSGDSFTFDYDGSYLGDGLTVVAHTPLASIDPCSGTTAQALGSTTAALANAPQDLGSSTTTLQRECPTVPSSNGCSYDVVDTFGLRVRAAVGYAQGAPTGATPPPAVTVPSDRIGEFTVDTGSLGAVVPADEIGPNAIGPGGPAYEYYDSSGYVYLGSLYLAPMTFTDGTGQLTTVPIRVIGVTGTGCYVDASACTPPSTDLHYLGVGFDRSSTASGSGLASPTDNALLRIVPADVTDHTAGFVLGPDGIESGLTASNTAGFATSSLTRSPTVPGDWSSAAGAVSITRGAVTHTATGTMLMDIGIDEMFIDAAPATYPLGLAAGDTIAVTNGAGLSYSFVAGDPTPTGEAPSAAELVHLGAPPVGQVFVNTGRHVLFGQDFLFDASRGQVGYRALTTPLR